MNADDARRTPRYSVEDVEGSVMISHGINIINVSLDGISFSTSKCLQVGRVYLIKIPHGDRSIPVRGEVSWCRLDGSAKKPGGDIVPVYVVGAVIKPSNAETATAFDDFVRTFKKHVCAFGKIKVEVTLAPGTPQELTLSTPFPVRTLSLEKMRLETDAKFPVGSNVGLDVRFDELRHLHLTGQIVSSEKTKATVFLVNVALAPPAPADRKRFEEALAEIYAGCG